MSDATQVLILLLCAASFALVIYLIFLVMKLMRVLDNVQTRLDKQVSPLLDEASETINHVNGILSKLHNSVDWLSGLTHRDKKNEEQRKTEGPTHRLITKLGQSAAVWMAGLVKAKASMKKK